MYICNFSFDCIDLLHYTHFVKLRPVSGTMGWSVRTRKIGAQALGYFCICIFFVLTTQIVYMYYETIIPSAWEKKNYTHFLFHVTIGNWIAVNIYFNFIMACTTSPGLAKEYQHLATQYPTCKKCSMNKPPRTRHCRWCDTCVLKYDHHCPCKQHFENSSLL